MKVHILNKASWHDSSCHQWYLIIIYLLYTSKLEFRVDFCTANATGNVIMQPNVITSLDHHIYLSKNFWNMELGILISVYQSCKRRTKYLEFSIHSYYLPYLLLGVVSEVLLVTPGIHWVMTTSDSPQYLLHNSSSELQVVMWGDPGYEILCSSLTRLIFTTVQVEEENVSAETGLGRRADGGRRRGSCFGGITGDTGDPLSHDHLW
jgi:hypothetical protein